jgi:eukaryotic-like serine/threonine-protein kinase
MKRGCFDNLLFVAVLLIAFAGSTYFWFNFFIRGKSLPTPNLVGKSVNDARAICSDLGVNLNIDNKTRRNSDKVPAGYVVWQNRTAGNASLIKRGTTIRVELSAGPLILRVPDLDGQSAGTAVLRLGQQNLKIGNLAYADAWGAGAPAGGNQTGIVAADPAKGTVVAAQTPVSLLVSVPPQPAAYVMPDLIDHALDEARPYLEGHGLKVSTVKFEAYPGIRDGIIIRQFPVRGAPVSARDAITVVVSKQEESGIIEQQAGPPPPTTTQ